MKLVCCLVILCYTAVPVTGQQGPMQFPFLGRPIELFKDSLICKDALKLDKPYSKELKCMSYMVTHPGAVYRYGRTEFPVVVVFPDSSDVIRSFSHFKSYLKDSVVSDPGDDFRALRDHFNRRFNSEGVRSKVRNLYNKDEIITWKIERIKVILRWSSIKNRKNVRLDSILDLYIEEDKK